MSTAAGSGHRWLGAARAHLAWRLQGRIVERTPHRLALEIDGTVEGVSVDEAELAAYGQALFEPLPIEPPRGGHADFAADRLEEHLLAARPDLLARLRDGRPWGVWLSHDIDFLRMSYHVVTHPLRMLTRGDRRGATRFLQEVARARARGTDLYWNLDDMMALERAYGRRATYFMLEQPKVGAWWRPSSVPFRYGMYRFEDPAIVAQIARLVAGGMEVGVHGSFGTASGAARLAHETRVLGTVAGHPIVTARQHFLDFRVWETAEGYVDAGIRVASNVGFNPDGWGWRTRSAHAIRVPRPDGTGLLPLLEVPPAIMDGALMGDDWQERLDRLLTLVVQHRGAISVIWHNTVVRPGHPQRARFEWFLQRLAALEIPTPVGADFVPQLDPP